MKKLNRYYDQLAEPWRLMVAIAIISPAVFIPYPFSAIWIMLVIVARIMP